MQLILGASRTAVGNRETHALHQFQVPSGDDLEVYSAGVSDQNGDAPNGLEMEVYNITTSNVVLSITNPTDEWSPSTTLGVSGNEVIVRIDNQTGGEKDISGFFNSEVG
jgi:hypothetical protein